MDYGIALSGGGSRGSAHVGVLLALEEADLLPTSISGTSAGSIVAGLFALGYSPFELKKIVHDLSKTGGRLMDPDYLGFFKELITYRSKNRYTSSGLLKGYKLEKFLCNLSKGVMMKDVPMKLVIPAVDLNSGTTIAYTNALLHTAPVGNVIWDDQISLCLAMRASSSIPAIFRPVILNGRCLVDGGVTDILPVDLLVAAGTSKVLGVDISENYTVPNDHSIIEIIFHSFNVMGTRLRSYVSSQGCYTIKIDLPDHAGLFSFKYIEECMDIGYQVTKENIPKLRKTLELC